MLKIGLLICLLLPALAQANSGRILYVTGKVTVERGGKIYRAVKNAKLTQGDMIKTGRLGRMHIRMSDRTLVSLKPDTNFQIETYRFDTQRSVPAAQTSAQRSQARAATADRSVFRLVKGGFRAITGLIGKRDRSAFGVSTPVATIGIRGTSFVANLSGGPGDIPSQAMNTLQGVELAALSQEVNMPVIGSASMSDADGLMLAQSGPANASPLKLTVGVANGAVILSNSQGTLLLENGEFGQVLAGDLPSRLLTPPADSDDILDQEGGDQEEEDPGDTATDTKVATRVSSTDSETPTGGQSDQPPPGAVDEVSTEETEFIERRNVALASTLDNAANSLTLSTGAQRVDADGQVVAVVTNVERNGSTQVAAAELVGGVVTNAGMDPATALRWGRWSGGQVQLSFADGSQQNVNTGQANLHFIQSAVSTGVPVVPTTGSREFVLVGNTDPTTDAGSIGFLGNASLSANFDSQTVNSQIALSVDEQLWEASGTGAIGTALSNGTPGNLFAGDYQSVRVNSEGGGSGQFSGFFTEQAGAAGLSYRLDQAGASVNGAAAFEAVP